MEYANRLYVIVHPTSALIGSQYTPEQLAKHYTVGDPFKDTAGPSINILIKTMSVISLVIAPMLRQYWGG